MMAISKRKYQLWVKTRKACTLLADAFCVIMLGLGYGENSLPILIGRVAVSAILETINIFLTPIE